MKKIKDKDILFGLFEELNSGGLHRYDGDEQALVLRLESNGGRRENETFYLRFLYVEYFHLPLGLDGPTIDNYGIDSIMLISEVETKKLVPSCSNLNDYKSNEYGCYRFYANNSPSPFYIYCLSVEGWIES